MPKQGRRPVIAWRWFVLSIVVMLLVFIPAFRLQQAKIAQQQAELLDLENQRYTAVMTGEDIRKQMQNAGSAQYIEQQARREYGYMMPGEIRFIVDNLPQEGAAPDQTELAAQLEQQQAGQQPIDAPVYQAEPQATQVPTAPQTVVAVPAEQNWGQFSD